MFYDNSYDINVFYSRNNILKVFKKYPFVLSKKILDC